jgi:hypothetical protein
MTPELPSIAPTSRSFTGDRGARPVPIGSDERDVVLVLAAEPLRGMIAELMRANGYEVRASTTPLETVLVLERLQERLRCAIISSQLPWGAGAWELLVDEYPDVEPVVLED